MGSNATNNRKIYLDHNATTFVQTQALVETLLQASQDLSLGNPSSIHWAGQGAKKWIRETRHLLAQSLGVHPLELIFTSGGSESNNTVIKSVWMQQLSVPQAHRRTEYIVSQVEHPSVIRPLQYLEKLGHICVHWIPVNKNGFLDLDFIRKRLSSKTALVSVMIANNETGSLFPISEIASWAHEHGAFMHTDAVQSLGKMPVDIKKWQVDFASFSGHKFYALKGCGLLYCKKGSVLEPLIHGGGQERGRRGGTENTLAIASLGQQMKNWYLLSEKIQHMQKLRDFFENTIVQALDGVSITAQESPRLPNVSSLVIQGIDGEVLLMSLDLKGFAVSTGAACSSGNPEPSPVLLAMGLSKLEAQSSLRVSLGWETTQEEIVLFIETLQKTVLHLRSVNHEKKEVGMEYV